MAPSISSYPEPRSSLATSLRRPAGSKSSNVSERLLGGIRRQPSLRKISPQQEGGESPNPSQLSDLVALSYGRLYRNQELVWLVLDKPLSINTNSRSDKNFTLRLWPGVIKGLVSPATYQQAESSETRYLVTIISTKRSYFVPQKSIIPLRAYNPDENALADLQSLAKNTPPDTFGHDFDPLPESGTLETSSPGSLRGSSPLDLLITDIKVAKRVATTWAITDGYCPTSQQPGEPAVETPSPAITSPGTDVSHVGPLPLRYPMEGRRKRKYGGLWWGAERIWVGDLLILSFPESSIKYSSEDSSCFAHEIHDEDPTGHPPLEDRRPEEKCVFLKLRALETVRTEQGFTSLEAIGGVYRLTRSLDPVQPKEASPDNLGLPPPPDGFVFRAVLSAGIETQLPLRLIRGRYYPRLLSTANNGLASVARGLKAMGGLGPVGSAAWRPSKHATEPRHRVLDVVQDSAKRDIQLCG